MSKLINLTGRKFGRLTVLSRIPGRTWNHVMWSCLCDCGKTVETTSQNIRTGHTQSCGCRQKDIMRKIRTKHGLTNGRIWSPVYYLWSSAKYRAKIKGLEFSIEPSDISVPDVCPLLDIPISRRKKSLGDNSPTLDRVDGTKGYTKDNIWVISYKANRSKNNLSLDELKKLVANLEVKKNSYAH
jgi:hypothetical protein